MRAYGPRSGLLSGGKQSFDKERIWSPEVELRANNGVRRWLNISCRAAKRKNSPMPQTQYAEGGHPGHQAVDDAAIAQERTESSLPDYTLLMKQALEGRV
jgi:hypothetical protein